MDANPNEQTNVNLLKYEQTLATRLKERFDYLSPTVQRARRLWVDVPREKFVEILTFLRDGLEFSSLCTVTGLDAGEEYQLIYILARDDGIVLCVKESAPKSDPVFDTATDLYKGGILYEIEPCNLLGLTVRGIPEDIRYPLPDNWPADSYPLRKDWQPPVKKTEQSAEEK